MIKSFSDSEAEKIWKGFRSKKLPNEIQETARRKLRIISNSLNVDDLRIPPGNKLEMLKGKLSGFHSIRINDQWRVVFKWSEGDAFDVKITDYH